ncbi:MAG: YhbY family RNA-binding protein [Gammaproteobacteria bacterium]|nr:YhbY family RNA-binding protein [Gammaproteobacteria bacterium]
MNNHQKKYLRSLLNNRNVIIWIGQKGLTDAVLNELEQALDHHELVKIKIRNGDKAERDDIIEKICQQSSAIHIQTKGSITAIYRANTDNPVINLPN